MGSYCNMMSKPADGSRPKHDPAKHDTSFLEGFFDYVGSLAATGANPGMFGTYTGPVVSARPHGRSHPVGEPPSKRMRSSGGGSSFKSSLVERIKNFQKSGEDKKQMWHDHCDSNLGNVRDPNRHDEHTLEAFVSMFGVP